VNLGYQDMDLQHGRREASFNRTGGGSARLPLFGSGATLDGACHMRSDPPTEVTLLGIDALLVNKASVKRGPVAVIKRGEKAMPARWK
jgi:hypothetical protein